MKSSRLSVFLLFTGTALFGRPAPINTPIGELFQKAAVVVTIRPVSTSITLDSPSRTDPYLDNRDLSQYQGMETECEVLSVIKGAAPKKLKILHFAFKAPRPEFNGGIFVYFHLGKVHYETFPATAFGQPKGPRFAASDREFLAFLKELPDGRFAPILGQYDSACSFRLLSIPDGGYMYHARDDASWRIQPKQPKE